MATYKGQETISSRKKQHRNDRFIPSRICTNLYNLFKDEKVEEEQKQSNVNKYSNFLEEGMFGEGQPKSGKKILRFTAEDK